MPPLLCFLFDSSPSTRRFGSYFIRLGTDRPAAGGCEDGTSGGREDETERQQEPGRRPSRGGRQQDVKTMGQLLHAGQLKHF